MKTIHYAIAAALVTAVFGLAGTAEARTSMNKNLRYQQGVNAIVGTTAEAPRHVWKHMSRFARENHEKAALGGRVFPAQEREILPKSFRNNN